MKPKTWYEAPRVMGTNDDGSPKLLISGEGHPTLREARDEAKKWAAMTGGKYQVVRLTMSLK